jgi:hypothetical protein
MAHAWYSAISHEIVLPILAAVLVAGCLHVVLVEEIIVRMVFLPLLLLALLGDTGLLLSLRRTSQSVRFPRAGLGPLTLIC